MGFGGDRNDQASAMGALIGAHDWSTTTLGAFETWNDPLRTALSLCLGADFPVALWWGTTLVQLYNDPFRQAIGATRHASGFASPLARGWPDLWPLLSPAVKRVQNGEPTVRLHDLPVVSGAGEAGGLFAMSLSPVPAAELPVGGILAVFHQAEPWADVDRSQGFLLAFGEALRRPAEPDDVVAEGCRRLCLHLGLERAGFASLDEGSESGSIWPDWPRLDAGGAPARFHLADFGAAAVSAWRAGRTVFAGGNGTASAGEPESARLARVPVPDSGGRLAAIVFAQAAAPRAWSGAEQLLLRRAGDAMRDALSRARLGQSLERQKEEAGALRESLPAFAWRAADDGGWIWAGPQWSAFTGQPVAAGLGAGWLDALHPDDREAVSAAWAEAGKAGRFHAEARLRRGADGAWRWFRMQAAPGGPSRQWIGTSVEVDDLHRLRERQAALVRESQRRASRTLALIRALARRSVETDTTAAGYAMHLDGRLDAFARVQAIVPVEADGEVELDYLVAEELAAHGAHEDGVIHMSGPAVRLRLLAAQALGLAVHELVTHAVEDGALLGNAGAIRIGWQVAGEEGGRRQLRFEWEESSGQAHERKAPNFSLLEKMLQQEMNAVVAVSARPGGFVCRITLPLPVAETVRP